MLPALATFFLLTKVLMQFAAYSEGDRKSSYIIQSVAAEVRVEYNSHFMYEVRGVWRGRRRRTAATGCLLPSSSRPRWSCPGTRSSATLPKYIWVV